MKKPINKILLFVFLMLFTVFSFMSVSQGSNSSNDYTKYRTVDLGSFNEYRYKLTKEYIAFRSSFEINDEMNKINLQNIDKISKEALNYLPNDLTNDDYQNKLSTAVAKALRHTSNDDYYSEVVSKIEDFIKKTEISAVAGTIEAIPKEGNAPLTVTFRGKVIDPSGSTIPKYNYIWWMDEGGNRKIIGTGPSFNYTFIEEGNFSVFLDVKSNHKNDKGYTDVLPFRGKTIINVKEKVASLIIKVNSDSLKNTEELKFTPDDARYGLLFDATSSSPMGGAKFTETIWDFGNGVIREYDGDPRVERVIYTREGEYTINLKIRTNLGSDISKSFVISIRDPIAAINISPETGFLGDKFTFSTKSSGRDKNLTYSWEIIDIKNDKIIKRIQSKLFTYTFTEKGQFNVKLNVGSVSSEKYDVETKIVYINSRAPIATFNYKILKDYNPNRVLLDATESYDPDYTDNGKLKYIWEIDGERVNLEDANPMGSIGYYTFDSIGSHNIILRIEDPDGMEGIKNGKISIKSVLSVDFSAIPRSIKRGQSVEFKASSAEAKIFEWDFDDGSTEEGIKYSLSHTFEKKGVYEVRLKVRDLDENINEVTKMIYVGDGDSPVAMLDLEMVGGEIPVLSRGACDGIDAYIINRAKAVTFDAGESIDIDGSKKGLDYSLKVGGTPRAVKSVNYRFDEIGCFPVKLTVSSKRTKTTDTRTIWVKVENLKPTLDALRVQVVNMDTDPIIVNVVAEGAEDLDGVITSYLWYYYTDSDPEAQDFRATTSSSTKFVLPKIAGQYYFVVLLTDDNETRVSSEDLSRKATISLVGDNANVPLVDLKVDDNSLYIEDEIVFTADVKNLAGKNISKGASYHWDFDGDGFYDKESTTNIISYKYEKSGEFFAKVKVKYKGYSNTRTVKIDVTNRLEASFEYISIGNKYIFINNSKGSYKSVIWKMGDSKEVEDKDVFTYTYTDKKLSHDVEIIISEGNKTKKYTATVEKSAKNFLAARKMDFVVFTKPELLDSEKIILKEKQKEIYIYFGSTPGNISKYIIDTNTDIDVDLNGTKDDDEDLKNNSGDAFKVKLDNYREQKIRLIIKDDNDIEIDSKEITILKEYIEFDIVDVDTIIFDKITDSEKEMVEELKSIISLLPTQEVKVKSMDYLQRLQEEWSDNYERTQIILEFEGYLGETNSSYKDEIINILELILLEGEKDESVEYIALVNLIPDTILCEYSSEYDSCKALLVNKLDSIKASGDSDSNKILGSEILKVIEVDTLMSIQNKTDFKAILQSLVYGGVENIPGDIKDDIIEVEPSGDSFLGGLFATLLKILIWLIIIFFVIFVGYYGYFKLSNKDKSKNLQDFILDKTKHKDNESLSSSSFSTSSSSTPPPKDILGDIGASPKKGLDIKPKKDSKAPDWLAGTGGFDEELSSKEVEGKDIKPKKEEKNIKKVVKNTAPSWLKDDIKEDNKEEVKEKKEMVAPKITFDEKPLEKTKQKSEIKKQEVKKPKVKEEKSLEELTSLDDSKNIPDWLKGSLDEDKKSEKQKARKTERKVPDWLKGSLEKKEKLNKSDVKLADKKIEEKKLDVKLADKKIEEKKLDVKLADKKIKEIKTEAKLVDNKKEEIKSEEKEEKKIDSESKDEIDTKKTENIPDWLKGSFDEEAKDKKEEKKPEVLNLEEEKEEEKEVKEIVSESKEEKEVKTDSKKTEEIPDWLKGTFDENKEEKKEEVKTEEKEEKKIDSESEEEIKPEEIIKESEEKTDSIKKEEVKKTSEKPKEEEKKELPTKAAEEKTDDKKTGDTSSELWDNGMDIPDWLKTDEK